MPKRPPKRAADSASKLLESIAKEGMVSVAQRSDLSIVDKSLIKLLAGFRGLKGSKEMLKFLKTNPEILDIPQEMKYKLSGMDMTKGEAKKRDCGPETEEEKLS